jgi:putative ABC transport system ATP-binding protein
LPPPRLELRNVSKDYSNDGSTLKALDDISFTAEAGTVTAILGRSGCGKSTLLNLAGAMDFPTTGQVLVDGRPTTGLREAELTALRRKSIGFVFQFFQLLPNLTVLENVELPLLLSGASNTITTAMERLRWVGLAEKSSVYPHQISGGQMQRVAVARAVVQSPELLIADEPTGNLDTASGELVLGLIRRAADDLGAAVLMATHSTEAAAIAHTRIHLRDGRIETVHTKPY